MEGRKVGVGEGYAPADRITFSSDSSIDLGPWFPGGVAQKGWPVVLVGDRRVGIAPEGEPFYGILDGAEHDGTVAVIKGGIVLVKGEDLEAGVGVVAGPDGTVVSSPDGVGIVLGSSDDSSGWYMDIRGVAGGGSDEGPTLPGDFPGSDTFPGI